MTEHNLTKEEVKQRANRNLGAGFIVFALLIGAAMAVNHRLNKPLPPIDNEAVAERGANVPKSNAPQPYKEVSNANILPTDPSGDGEDVLSLQGTPMNGDGENVVPGENSPENQATDAPSDSNAEYVGVWVGDVGGLIQVKLKFEGDGSCEILINGQEQIRTTYKVVNGKFQALYNHGEEAMGGSISYGKRGTYLDFCHYYGLKSKPGEVGIFGNSAKGKECGSAIMR